MREREREGETSPKRKSYFFLALLKKKEKNDPSYACFICMMMGIFCGCGTAAHLLVIGDGWTWAL
jgi:hypothetical protein